MLDQKVFGEKLRNHRKKHGMTQEEVAEKVGVSAQAISKWEAGDCLPDCFNLKAISDVYKISVDVLLETESDGDIEAVANKIEQLGTEFIWAKADCGRYGNLLHQELGEDLWQMWKGLYFAETGDRKIQQESKEQGNLRISGVDLVGFSKADEQTRQAFIHISVCMKQSKADIPSLSNLTKMLPTML